MSIERRCQHRQRQKTTTTLSSNSTINIDNNDVKSLSTTIEANNIIFISIRRQRQNCRQKNGSSDDNRTPLTTGNKACCMLPSLLPINKPNEAHISEAEQWAVQRDIVETNLMCAHRKNENSQCGDIHSNMLQRASRQTRRMKVWKTFTNTWIASMKWKTIAFNVLHQTTPV